MPVISRFNGITIRMYLRKKEHNPPHIHVIYGEYIGLFTIAEGDMFEGDLPIKTQAAVKQFISYYRERLLEMWETQKFEILSPIS